MTLATQPTDNVIVTVASGDTDIATVSPSKLTFSTSNYNTAKTVTVTGSQDTDGKDESTTVSNTASGGGYNNLSANYAAKVTDDDRALTVSALSGTLTEGSNTTKTYTVKLAAEPAASVTVAVASQDEGAATVSPSKLTFSTSNYNTNQTVTVSPVDDLDGENETVTIANTADSGYGSVTANVTANVTDDDSKNLSISPVSGTVTEGSNTPTTYTVTLSALPTANVTVSVTSGDTDAATVSPSSLTFSTSSYNTAQTVTVSAEDDADGRDESVTISNEADGGGYDDVSENYTASVTDDDRALTVSALSGTLTEGSNTTKTYTVKLAAKPAASVTVAVASEDTDAATVSPSKLTFSTSSWNKNKTVRVSAVDDLDGENESVTITNTADAGYGSVTASTTASVTDDDTKALTLSVSPAGDTVVEGSTATYTVKLATEPTDNVTVSVISSDTEIATVSPSKLTFTTDNYNTAQTVTVTGAQDDDGKDEGVTITNEADGGGYNGVSEDHPIDVTDDDRALTVSALSETLTEGANRPATYTVKLAAEPAASVTVAVASEDTEAATVGPSKLTFSTSNYNTAQTVTVSAVDDDDGENESVTITNTADAGYGSVTANATASVTDDDTKALTLSASPAGNTVVEGSTAKYTVKLATKPTSNVTVSVSSGDTDIATVSPSKLTFSASNYNTTKTVTVSGVQDDDGKDESVTIAHAASGGGYGSVSANYTAKVTDDDRALTVSALSGTLTEGSNKTGTYTVKLAAEPAASVTVAVASQDEGAATVSPSKLTFSTSDYNTAQTVTVSPVDDLDGENESVTIANTADAGYGSVTASATATVTDDDSKNLSISPISGTVTEGSNTPVTYTVTLSALPTNNVTVSVSSGDTNAATVSPSKLTFSTSNYNTNQTVSVSGVDDSDGRDESVTISHAASGGGYNNVSENYTANVADDDRALTVTPTSVTVGEASTVKYKVKLAASPAASVTVSVASGDTDAATVSPSKLTFSTSSWNNNKTVTISGVHDADGTDESVPITNTADAGYGSVTASVTANVIDDDRGLTFSPTSVTVDEGSTATYTVKLATQPSASVTVSVARQSGGDTDLTVSAGSPLTFTTSSYNTAQTVTVSAAEDNTDSINGTAAFTHAASGGNYANVTGSVTVTEADNDRNLAVTPTSVTVGEGSSAKYTVKLVAKPSTSVTVSVSSNDTGATRVSPSRLVFTTSSYNTNKTVTVRAVT